MNISIEELKDLVPTVATTEIDNIFRELDEKALEVQIQKHQTEIAKLLQQEKDLDQQYWLDKRLIRADMKIHYDALDKLTFQKVKPFWQEGDIIGELITTDVWYKHTKKMAGPFLRRMIIKNVSVDVDNNVYVKAILLTKAGLPGKRLDAQQTFSSSYRLKNILLLERKTK